MGKWTFKTWRAEKAYAEILMGEHPIDQGGEVHLAIAEAQTVIQSESEPEPESEPAPAPPPQSKKIPRK